MARLVEEDEEQPERDTCEQGEHDAESGVLGAPATRTVDEHERTKANHHAGDLPDLQVITTDEADDHRERGCHEPGDRCHDTDQVQRHRPVERHQSKSTDGTAGVALERCLGAPAVRQEQEGEGQRDEADALNAEGDTRGAASPPCKSPGEVADTERDGGRHRAERRDGQGHGALVEDDVAADTLSEPSRSSGQAMASCTTGSDAKRRTDSFTWSRPSRLA